MRFALIAFVAVLTLGYGHSAMSQEFRLTEKVTILADQPVIQDGLDLSNRRLPGLCIHRKGQTLRDVDFSNSDLTNADLRETIFNHCSFRGAILTGINISPEWYSVKDCDFTDAIINEIRDQPYRFHPLTLEQIQSSRSWKTKDLRRVEIYSQLKLGKIDPISFAGFDLRDSHVMVREEVDLTDANVQGATLYGGFYHPPLRFGVPLSEQHQESCSTGNIDMLMKTKNGKDRDFTNVTFKYFNFTGANFSGMDLSGVEFGYCNLTDANFTDAVITRANFYYDCFSWDFENMMNNHTLTLEQIKQTWNYKHGVMKGIALPDAIRAALEAEKEKSTAETNETPEESKAESEDSKATEVVKPELEK
ncbi:MAG: pentapeptide repeat-containing protein [Thermoguttaceae bacterium]|nr:pentapeptide repeat-containing protein [Thermoguttaceae bacterium]